MSEVALISARKSRLAADQEKGSKGARIALNLANDPDRFLSTVQIGITLIGILTGIFSGNKIAVQLTDFLPAADWRRLMPLRWRRRSLSLSSRF